MADPEQKQVTGGADLSQVKVEQRLRNLLASDDEELKQFGEEQLFRMATTGSPAARNLASKLYREHQSDD